MRRRHEVSLFTRCLSSCLFVGCARLPQLPCCYKRTVVYAQGARLLAASDATRNP
ncbi:MAG: hypothetical protein LBI71_03285 [Enterobacteriaceae bacterium]|nr:hypothetical protein [Enterobacteriaceae bacterium]